MSDKKPLRRTYEVTLAPDDAARLRAFDNTTDAEAAYPLGGNRSFRRKDETTFVVKDWTSTGVGSAWPTSVGRATFTGDLSLNVTIRSGGLWLGWLLIAGGVLCVAVTPRDGVPALLVGLALIAAGYFLWLGRFVRTGGLDDVEAVLRRNLRGTWRPT